MSIVNYDKIKELSIQKLGSPEDVAKSFGISKASFYNYIKEKRGFSLDDLINISKILECDLNDLLLKEINIVMPQPSKESGEIYESLYDRLKEKDNTIKAQNQTINAMMQTIEILKEKCKDGQGKDFGHSKSKAS
jgi:DNA-binding Xre family transcriptional regulator